jgi:methylmalonyl-CoA mutase
MSERSSEAASSATATESYRPENPVRFVTAASLFDGHDAAINIFRRLLQRGGAEVVHLGHNRSAEEVVDAAIQEDAQAIAVSSYQGGRPTGSSGSTVRTTEGGWGWRGSSRT